MAIRVTIVTKAPLRVQFLPALGGEWERGKAKASSSALLSKKRGVEGGSIESQQKFDILVLILCLRSLEVFKFKMSKNRKDG